MRDLDIFINSFVKLGAFLQTCVQNYNTPQAYLPFDEVVKKSKAHNPWFTENAILQSIQSICTWLEPSTLTNWIYFYTKNPAFNPPAAKKVAVIMAGNIPMVNFHDFIGAMGAGHQFLGKLSSQDLYLLPFVANALCEIEPSYQNRITFTQEIIKNVDAIIATGSNNASRYFEYYFAKYPHIIRKNRHSVAVLTGTETPEQLAALGNDIFDYFGMGCRNVSKLYLPKSMDPTALYPHWQHYETLILHHKYKHNYDYHRAILLLNQTAFFDNGFAVLREHESIVAPMSQIHFEFYNHTSDVIAKLENQKNEIQCVVSIANLNHIQTIQPGKTQCPSLFDYPDGEDIMDFLIKI